MLRVLVVDDSETARQFLVETLSSDQDIQVVGVAKNGVEAVRLTKELEPDIVTMDILMPVMNGFEATREIMITSPRPIVIVSTGSKIADAEKEMEALRAGALTLIVKPRGPCSKEFATQTARLIETVKTMAGVKVIRRSRRVMDKAPTEKIVDQLSRSPTSVIAIVASTGGPPALQTVLAGLPADFPIPILVVQHLAQGFIHGLVSWLDASVGLHVKIAEAGEAIAGGTVYVGPDDAHLGITKSGRIELRDSPPIGGFRPSGNFLFDSIASRSAAAAVAVILTGMGSDGVQGLQTIRSVGGQVLAQDAESCVVNGMPGSAVAAGVVNKVVDLESIALELRLSAGLG